MWSSAYNHPDFSPYTSESFVSAYPSANAPSMFSWYSDTASGSAQPSTPLIRPRTLLAFIKFSIPLLLLSLLLTLIFWDPHVEIAFYSRGWIKQEVKPIRPLAGCFSPKRVSPHYNLTDTFYGRKQTVVHAGMPLRLGMDCYDFAGTIPPSPHAHDQPPYIPPDERIQYHTYWRTDLAPFGPRQEWTLKSFFATQNLNTSRLVLWSNGDLLVRDTAQAEVLRRFLRTYPDAFALRVVDYRQLARETALEASAVLQQAVTDERAWVDGDLVRLLVLWAYGGVWVDMDTLLTRSLAPLLEHEFVTQWDCYDKLYVPFNGALMRFRQHSPYLCEAFHIMHNSAPPRPGSTDWGATLYLKLWRRLVAASVPPFSVLPFCFTDARSCRMDNRLPDPFERDPESGVWTEGMGREEGGGLDTVLGKVFAVHLHNQWEKTFPMDGWVQRLLLNRYEERLPREMTERGKIE